MSIDPMIARELYDPSPKKRKKVKVRRVRKMKKGKVKSKSKGKAVKRAVAAPKRWMSAMIRGIRRSSDVRDPVRIVKDIWKRLPGQKKLSIISKEKKGHRFVYDLPLPDDHKTRGVGTVRVVKPFKLAEVQVNVTPSSFEKIKRTRQFQNMRRQDGTVALVKRCKSKKGNCNIFVDKAR